MDLQFSMEELSLEPSIAEAIWKEIASEDEEEDDLNDSLVHQAITEKGDFVVDIRSLSNPDWPYVFFQCPRCKRESLHLFPIHEHPQLVCEACIMRKLPNHIYLQVQRWKHNI